MVKFPIKINCEGIFDRFFYNKMWKNDQMECFVKMASPSQSLISVGECVRCDGRVWMVSTIQNRFGWNQLHLVDLDSGVRAAKARFQLETLPFVDVSMYDSFTAEGDGVEDAVAPTSAETGEDRSAKPTVNGKWRNRSDADLTHLQEMRHSKSTSQQTRWAAKIFRGESAIFLKCCHWAIIDLGGIRQYFSRKTSKH